jgi:hypothetical protein
MRATGFTDLAVGHQTEQASRIGSALGNAGGIGGGVRLRPWPFYATRTFVHNQLHFSIHRLLLQVWKQIVWVLYRLNDL